jgi:beta-phosphoglucomutase family hydrolase
MIESPSAVIFDMDGTLVATTELDFLAWQKLFKEYGVNITFQQYFPLLGKKSSDMVLHFLNVQGQNAIYPLTKKMEYFDQLVDLKGIEILPNSEKILSELKNRNIPLALATSSRQRKMKRIMQQTGFAKYFDVFVTGEEVQKGKPNPDIFLLAAQRLSIDPSNCLVFEDAINGVIAAKSAGMKCIAITNTHQRNDLQMADVVIDDFNQITSTQISSLFS